MSRAALVRVASRALVIVAALVVIVAVRVVTSSREALATAESLRARGELDAAIVAYRRAARWYAPGNPFAERAVAQLSELGAEAERAGDTERALRAFRAVHAAALTSRSVLTPYAEARAHADARIAELSSRPAPGAVSTGTVATRRARIAESLAHPSDPGVAWSLAALLGLAAWLCGAMGLAWRGVDAEDRVRSAEARAWGTLVVFGVGVFVVALALA